MQLATRTCNAARHTEFATPTPCVCSAHLNRPRVGAHSNPSRSSFTIFQREVDDLMIVELLLFRMQLELQHNRATLLRGSGLENDKMENSDGLGQITLADQTD